MTAPHRFFDPLLTDEQAEAMLRLCESFGSYGTYSKETIEDGFGAPGVHEVARHEAPSPSWGLRRVSIHHPRQEGSAPWPVVFFAHGFGATQPLHYRQLVDHLLAWSHNCGDAAVELRVTDSNAPAVALYEHLGFVRTGETEPLESDPTLTTLVLRRTF